MANSMTHTKRRLFVRLVLNFFLWLFSWGLLLAAAALSASVAVLFQFVFHSEKAKILIVSILFGGLSIASTVFLARTIYARELSRSKELSLAKYDGMLRIGNIQKCRFRLDELPIGEQKAIVILKERCLTEKARLSDIVACFLAMASGSITIISILLTDEALIKDVQLQAILAVMAGVIIFVSSISFIAANISSVFLVRKIKRAMEATDYLLKRHRHHR